MEIFKHLCVCLCAGIYQIAHTIPLFTKIWRYKLINSHCEQDC